MDPQRPLHNLVSMFRRPTARGRIPSSDFTTDEQPTTYSGPISEPNLVITLKSKRTFCRILENPRTSSLLTPEIVDLLQEVYTQGHLCFRIFSGRRGLAFLEVCAMFVNVGRGTGLARAREEVKMVIESMDDLHRQWNLLVGGGTVFATRRWEFVTNSSMGSAISLHAPQVTCKDLETVDRMLEDGVASVMEEKMRVEKRLTMSMPRPAETTEQRLLREVHERDGIGALRRNPGKCNGP